MKGKCGICGDAYDAKPRQHEAPGVNFINPKQANFSYESA